MSTRDDLLAALREADANRRRLYTDAGEPDVMGHFDALTRVLDRAIALAEALPEAPTLHPLAASVLDTDAALVAAAGDGVLCDVLSRRPYTTASGAALRAWADAGYPRIATDTTSTKEKP